MIAMILLTGCGTAGSDHDACPPVVEYPAAVQERAAAEIEAMPWDSIVAGMMADYHVLRQQARACGGVATGRQALSSASTYEVSPPFTRGSSDFTGGCVRCG